MNVAQVPGPWLRQIARWMNSLHTGHFARVASLGVRSIEFPAFPDELEVWRILLGHTVRAGEDVAARPIGRAVGLLLSVVASAFAIEGRNLSGAAGRLADRVVYVSAHGHYIAGVELVRERAWNDYSGWSGGLH